MVCVTRGEVRGISRTRFSVVFGRWVGAFSYPDLYSSGTGSGALFESTPLRETSIYRTRVHVACLSLGCGPIAIITSVFGAGVRAASSMRMDTATTGHRARLPTSKRRPLTVYRTGIRVAFLYIDERPNAGFASMLWCRIRAETHPGVRAGSTRFGARCEDTPLRVIAVYGARSEITFHFLFSKSQVITRASTMSGSRACTRSNS